MDALKKVAAAARRLKVFPLPSVVLFPNTAVPLHIFEPRYRALVRDAVESDRVISLALLQDGWEGNYYGHPPLTPICCAGYIAQHQEMPDGRYLIVLEGVVRARVVRELRSDELYRQIETELLPDEPYEGPEEGQLRQGVLELASMLPQRVADEFIHEAACHGGGALADVVASHVVEAVPRRRILLEELDVQRRLGLVLGDVGNLIARANGARPHAVLN